MTGWRLLPVLALLAAACTPAGSPIQTSTSPAPSSSVPTPSTTVGETTTTTSTPTPESIPDTEPDAVGMTLREKAAQLVMVEFSGADGASVVELLASTPIGGVLIKSANGNLISADQTIAMIAELQRASTHPLLIAIDQEGGRIDRVRFESVVRFPSARVFGMLDDIALTEDAAWATGAQLGALGINVDFAPVADVNVLGDSNPAIGDRSFGADPELVSTHVQASVAGFLRSGIIPAAKHFPGHGNTTVDSHLGLPVIATPEHQWESTDLLPFVAAANANVPMVMVAHVAYPNLDETGLPASLSAEITGRLRAIFDGVIVTDDLANMAAVAGFGVGERAVLALQAGADVLLNPGDPELAVEAIVSAVESGRISIERLDASVGRLLSLKRGLGVDSSWPLPLQTTEEIREIAARITTACRASGVDC